MKIWNLYPENDPKGNNNDPDFEYILIIYFSLLASHQIWLIDS